MRICNNINQEPYESLNAKNNLSTLTKGLFRNVVVVVTVFQSVFHVEMHQNDFFFKSFLRYQNDLKHIKKLIFEFFWNTVPNVLLIKSKS
jgi:hypothetical protein